MRAELELKLAITTKRKVVIGPDKSLVLDHSHHLYSAIGLLAYRHIYRLCVGIIAIIINKVVIGPAKSLVAGVSFSFLHSRKHLSRGSHGDVVDDYEQR